MTAALARRVRNDPPKGLTRRGVQLLEYLAWKARDDGSFAHGGQFTDRALVEHLGYSARTLRRARAELVAGELLEVASGTGRRGTRYRLVVQAQLELAEAVGDTPGRVSRVASLAAQGGHPDRPGWPSCPPPTRARDGSTRSTGPAEPIRQTASPLPLRRPPRLVELEGARRELADALWQVRLRASCDLNRRELALVDQVLDRVGPAAMVAAAQAAYRAGDPPRSWRAWLRLWAGLQPRPEPPARAAPPAPAPAPASSSAAAPSPEQADAAVTVACPHCRAAPGIACHTGGARGGRRARPREPHPARVAVALEGAPR